MMSQSAYAGARNSSAILSDLAVQDHEGEGLKVVV